jgi:hypothetical protein
MTLPPSSSFRTHWFLLAAPLVIAMDVFMALTQRAEAPRLVEAGVLFDLAILLPALCWACYRYQGRKAIIRAVALSCLGIWVAGKLVPVEEQVLLTCVAPLRYVGLAVLVWIEIAIVLAIWRAILEGKPDAVVSVATDKNMPQWVAKLMAWEARFWLGAWKRLRKLFGRD